jgi:hypothetical protein
MKIRNRFIKGLLTAMITTVFMAQSILVSAAEPSDEEPYTYTVTLSAGNQGSFNGTETVKVTGITPGASVNFSAYSDQLQIEDEKYYAKGIRLSGRDNSDASYLGNWNVTGIEEDTDYVVAYGMRGDMVAYTVQYLDENGNELRPAETFYGSVGDKPVVAFQYIEGYLPQAYNLTKTLSANEAENVFPFVYTPSSETITITEVIEGTDATTSTTTPGGGAAGTGTPGGAAGTDTAEGGTDAEGGEGTAAPGEGGETAVPGQTGTETPGGTETPEDTQGEGTTEVEEPDAPRDIIDIDEEEAPTANIQEDNAIRTTSALPIVIGIVVAVVAVVAIICGAVYLKRKRR